MTDQSTRGTESRDLERMLAGWLQQLATAALAIQTVARAQWQLMTAEWRLACSAAVAALLAALLGGLFVAALGLTLLALAAWLLAVWLGSWIVALAVLCGILAACLAGSLMLLRRCLHWMSLPQTRARWRALTHDMAHRPLPSRGTSGQGEEA